MRVLIVGGGAAGLMAAGTAARHGHTVTVLERNARPARKVMITGKGRCNVTNACTVPEVIAQVRHNARFLYSALTAFTPQDTVAFFEALGVPLKTERGGRVFPVSDKAVDIVDALVGQAKTAGVHFLQGRAAHLLTQDGRCTGVTTQEGMSIPADAVIVATGGASYPGTGSTGDGYALAAEAGHTVVPPRASLVGLSSPDLFCLDLQGLSPKNVTLTLTDTQKNKVLYRELGEMLFTHFGVSGPLVLTASTYMDDPSPGRYALSLDWKPGLTPEQLDLRLQRDLTERANTDLGNALGKLLPRALIPVVLRQTGIPAGKKARDVTKAERRALAAYLKAMPIRVDGLRPLEEAIVTAGGVSVREVDARTMASKRLPGLYFAGEVLDVDACTGGFNLQIAFSTGVAAGTHLDA